MSNLSPEQSVEFIDSSRHAFEHLFTAIDGYIDAIASARRNLADIERDEEVFTHLFVDRDQWSADANHLHAQYCEKMKVLALEKSESNKSKEERLSNALESIGATIDSMSVLAGAVLQIAKQIISLRHGRKKPIIDKAKMIGSQNIVEIIWEGRNHAAHWEENEPRNEAVTTMLTTLSEELGLDIHYGKNNSPTILEALNWHSADHVIGDLVQLVQQPLPAENNH
ncbi:hypothetical protein BOV94_12615 [Solemya velum gill symbiont]|uniref:hypothetical protein n=1 Tax=Solemya velum gill symbiont TaxID=2340 RepID=UPI000995FF7F|nr:hypothetical protein [Solemya velum gill symbiont]OOY49060.1 hypothetical protein BOV94_12615 [Solemya velum gill symbiont]